MSRELHLDPVLLAQQPVSTTPAIAPQAVEFLLMCLASDRSFLAEAVHLLLPQYFVAEETALLYLWQTMQAAHTSYGGCSYPVVSMLLRQRIESGDNPFTPEQLQIIFRPDSHGLIFAVTNARYDPATVRFGRDLLKQFLYERSVVRPLQRVLHQGHRQNVPELNQFFGQIQKQNDKLRSLHEIPSVTVAPTRGSPFAPPSIFKRTGIPFIDEPIGGQRVGDCNGILGPTGGGKSTFSAHLATAMARICWSEAAERGSNNPDLVILASYEEDGKKCLPRIWSAAFQIPRRKLETLQWPDLTTQETLEDYERRLFSTSSYIPSESERYDAGSIWLNKCFYLLDLAGGDAYPGAGRGGVTELASYIDRIQQQRGQAIRGVFIDYAGLVISNFMATNNRDKRETRQFTKEFPNLVRQQISEKFQTTTWVLEQIRGEAGSFSPFKLLHHTDTAECKDFAQNMAVCGCLGVIDKTSGCQRLNWSKVRFRPGYEVPPITVRINDTFSLMEDVSDNFVADETLRRFISRSDAARIGGLDAAPSRVATMTGPRQRPMLRTSDAAEVV